MQLLKYVKEGVDASSNFALFANFMKCSVLLSMCYILLLCNVLVSTCYCILIVFASILFMFTVTTVIRCLMHDKNP